MSSLKTKYVLDEKIDWTFAKEKTNDHTHGFHQYPARMHPHIAKKVIEKFASENKVVLDPFMGSGGVLVESMIHGNNAIGIDVNPLAVLIAKVKTTPLKVSELELEFNKIMTKSKRDIEKGKTYDNKPKDFDLEFWFKDDVVNKLSILKKHITNLDTSDDVSNFFKVCFSSTARKASNQRNGIYKIYRMNKEKLPSFKPNTFEIFEKTCRTNIDQMELFSHEMKGKKVKSYPIFGNTANVEEYFKKIGDKVLEDGKAHLVVTSPPYGDHQTTVAYGQFSKHPGLWLDFPKSELMGIDKVGLGGSKKTHARQFDSPLLDSIISEVGKNDIVRADDVEAFFHDLDVCLEKITNVLKEGDSHCCFVVANRTVRRVRIPMDKIIVELGKKYGLKHIQTVYRNIINKAMATKNAPENISNHTGETMNKESIVLWKF